MLGRRCESQGDRFGEKFSAPKAFHNAYRVSVYPHLQVSRWRKVRRQDSAHRESMGILGYITKHPIYHKLLYYRHGIHSRASLFSKIYVHDMTVTLDRFIFLFAISQSCSALLTQSHSGRQVYPHSHESQCCQRV